MINYGPDQAPLLPDDVTYTLGDMGYEAVEDRPGDGHLEAEYSGVYPMSVEASLPPRTVGVGATKLDLPGIFRCIELCLQSPGFGLGVGSSEEPLSERLDPNLIGERWFDIPVPDVLNQPGAVPGWSEDQGFSPLGDHRLRYLPPRDSAQG